MDKSRIKQRESKRKEIFRKLDEDFKLPSPSGVALEVLRLCNSESSSLNEIADVIQNDPALSAEIIKYANSAFLSTGIQVASIQKATVKLGMKTVVNLALGFSLLSSNKVGNCAQFDYPLFWRTCLAEALAARELAKLAEGLDPDELFICALLAHMGTLSLVTIYPDEYGQLLEEKSATAVSYSLEEKEFGIDSAEFTMELFLKWGLPAEYALATGFHEHVGEVDLGTGRTQRVAVILFLAHIIAQLCQSKEAQPELLQLLSAAAAKFDVELNDFSEMFGVIVEGWHEHGRFLEISTSECYSYSAEDYSAGAP